MRVLIAPDGFTGTLSAVEAAQSIAAGWRRAAPGDELDLVPMADGGPGFVDVAHASLGGELLSVSATGPLGDRVPATLLLVDGTAYVEAAQACGLHLVPTERRDPGLTTTYGVGELIAAALDAGAGRVIVGLGGSGTNDGGAGALAALGAEPSETLRAGGAALAGLASLDLDLARDRVGAAELVAATDVDNPLLGLRGASNVYAGQKGADPEQRHRLDAALTRWAELAGGSPNAKGAGAAGGLSYGLMLIGASRAPGLATVAGLVGLAGRIDRADVVVTGEGCFDWQSLRGKVVTGVAAVAAERARPTVVLAGRVELGRREMASVGVESAYSVSDLAGSPEAAMDRPAERLAELAERVARTWSRRA